MKNSIRKMSKVLMLAMVMTILLAAQAQAKSVTAGKSYAKAKKVTTGTTTVKQSDEKSGYLKFTAAKTKKYTFTFSDLKSIGGDYQIVYAYAELLSDKYTALSYKQNGKKTDVLWLTTNYCWTNFPETLKSTTPYPKRSVTLKLKKKQKIVVHMNGSSDGSTYTYKLKIK